MDRDKKTLEKTLPPSEKETKKRLMDIDLSEVELEALEPSLSKNDPDPPAGENRQRIIKQRTDSVVSQTQPPSEPIQPRPIKPAQNLSQNSGWTNKNTNTSKSGTNENLGGFFHGIQTMMSDFFSSDSSKSAINENKLLQAVETFGPTILISIIFFTWAIYDHRQRPHIDVGTLKSTIFVERALDELSKGRRSKAKRMLGEAIKNTTDQEQAQRLQKILKQIR
ncbi:MAG: hypothetical protein KDD48_05270 [Bdellovibrionales bacterium]|nr:hypothetical protein [Bdellovibrionales bacterium]